MSNTAKFEHAHFYDAELDNTVKITPAEFIEEEHAGRIECTTMGCHGSLSYVSAHETDASNRDRGAHFRTNPYGENHSENCPLNPDPEIRTSLGMHEALQAGKSILLNINFACSPVKEKGELPSQIAREIMPAIDGFFRQDWIKSHKGQYAPYSGFSANKIAQDAGAFRRALEQAIDADYGQLVVSYLHGLFPWSSFYAKDQTRSDPSQKAQLTGTSVFENLFNELTKKNELQTAWRAAPALRHGVRLLKSARQSTGSTLFTNFRDQEGNIANTLEINDHEFIVQDVLRVIDPAIRTSVQGAKDFSFVATPYVERKNIQQAFENSGRPLHIYWPITSISQLILTNNSE